jgi:hypothetical protein
VAAVMTSDSARSSVASIASTARPPTAEATVAALGGSTSTTNSSQTRGAAFRSRAWRAPIPPAPSLV